MNQTRPKPTATYIKELTGGTKNYQGLIENLHHGLDDFIKETNKETRNWLIQRLDNDELTGFLATQYKSRLENLNYFANKIKDQELYEIIRTQLEIGIPWLKKNKNIKTQRNLTLDNHLNPFKGVNLKERISEAPQKIIDDLKKYLSEKTNIYVFEIAYQDAKKERSGDNYKLNPMSFQNVYPKSGKNIENYAKEIARLYKLLPTEIIHPQKKQDNNDKTFSLF